MVSDDVGLSPVPFYDNPEYKRHPNNTKTDQLLKGHWLPVLLEDEDGCSKLLIRCAGAVA